MKLRQLGIPRIITLLAALVMVAAGLVLSRITDRRDAVAPPQIAAPPVAVPADRPAEKLAAVPGAPTPPMAGRKTPEAAATAPTAGAPKPTAAGTGPNSPAVRSPRKPAPVARATSQLPLPPFSPPDFMPADTVGTPAPSGPAPTVLWLSGVIQGNPKVALLRRGENRYLVKEGQTFEGYRVMKITPNSATIQRGSRKQTLRVGQH